jgi:hypothetical protein
MKQILIKLNACQEAVEWVEDKTIEQAVNDCPRGDWMLWLAAKVDVDFQKLTLAKGLCANTVRHLMKDERSIKAVDTAIAFGEGKATLDELQNSSDAAYAAAYAAYDAAYADGAAAKKENQLQTANICREVFGKELIDKLEQL